jgi:peptide/nickel transport system ATP-binding protein/oligopeptide transport system ATP-binding protein
MYKGGLVEIEETAKILNSPKEEYTKSLVKSQLL